MGLGSTAKKVQTLAEVAEKTYKRINDLRQRVQALRETVDDTNERVQHLEREVATQRALLEAVAEEHDVDVEQFAAEVESTTEADGEDAAASSN